MDQTDQIMERHLKIKNQLGLHARAAAKVVQVSSDYTSNLVIHFDGQEVDGKSILSILTLACPLGSNIVLKADGPDAEKMLDALEGLVNDKFGEE
jgi:phosphotransferase system HPr (HPr) family protein